MADLRAILENLATEAKADLTAFSVKDKKTAMRIESVCRCVGNRAGVRLVMSCMLAKINDPKLDPREPYTEIGSKTCFSGRTYDEGYITAFVTKHKLPCNNTTAFLTPALRNLNHPLDSKAPAPGRPTTMYADSFGILEEVASGEVSARDVMRDIMRWLFTMKGEQEHRMASLLKGIEKSGDAIPPSSEAIATLLQQHLACRNSSRLPVLGVAAAYAAVSTVLGERALPLKGHNAADNQTGASGDVEICMTNDESVITVYEMKKKAVNKNDIDHAVTKIAAGRGTIDNYVFITSDGIEEEVSIYAASLYAETDGTEIVVLDYIGFVRHFLHFFHRYRQAFLDAYQALVLSEPASAVPQALKEAFLALRNSMVADETVTNE